jgi:hypothetical protein
LTSPDRAAAPSLSAASTTQVVGETSQDTPIAERRAPGDLPVVRVFVGTLLLLLAGYMFMGRGFAHLGIPPIYLGEIVLALGLVATTVAAVQLRIRPRLTWTVGLLLAFMAWGAIRTVPYLTTYGADALRDAVLWGYALFALMIYLLADRSWIERAMRTYGLIVPIFALWLPIGWLIWLEVSKGATTDRPGDLIPLVYFKAGDMAVHSVGAVAFLILFTAAFTTLRTFAWRYIVAQPLVWGMFVFGTVSRGALLAAISGLGLVLLATRRFLNWVPVVVALIVLVLALAFGPTVTSSVAGLLPSSPSSGPGAAPTEPPPWYQANRPATLDQFLGNGVSILTGEGDKNQVGTVQFRVAWWTKIVNYTVFGPYFLTGKGFGVNLADDDGFQPTLDHSLRAPHNSSMTVLARMGVPGFLVWVAIQALWALGMLRSVIRNRLAGDRLLSSASAVLFIYWFAIMIVTSFDPFIEGPQGGIWFWTIFGLGLVAMRLVPEPGAIDRIPLLGEAGWRDSLRTLVPARGGPRPAPSPDGDEPVPQVM